MVFFFCITNIGVFVSIALLLVVLSWFFHFVLLPLQHFWHSLYSGHGFVMVFLSCIVVAATFLAIALFLIVFSFCIVVATILLATTLFIVVFSWSCHLVNYYYCISSSHHLTPHGLLVLVLKTLPCSLWSSRFVSLLL